MMRSTETRRPASASGRIGGATPWLLAALVALGTTGCLDPIVGGECVDGFQADGRRCAPTGDDDDGGVPDDGAIVDGGPLPDGALPDAGPAPDGAIPDAGPLPDGAIPDGGPLPDGALPDGGPLPDGAIPDGGPLPDGAIPDGAIPDGAIPDGAIPDGGDPDAGIDPPCNIGELDCGGVCVLPDRDPDHCGGCDVACDFDQYCVAGVCDDICDTPFSLCRSLCVDYDTDPLNCGACGRVCASGICLAGACTTAPGHVVVVGHDFSSAPVSAMNRVAGNALFVARGTPVRVVVYEGDAPAAAITRIDAAFDSVATATGRSWSRVEATDAADVPVRIGTADALVIYPQTGATDAELVDLGTDWSTALDTFLSGGGVVLLFESGGTHDGTWQILDAAGLFTALARTDVSGDDVDLAAAGDAVAVGVPTPYAGRLGTYWFDTTEGTVVVEHEDGPVVIHRVILP